MSKAKREQLKKIKDKRQAEDGNLHRKVKLTVDNEDFPESISRDASVTAQLLNDFPRKEGINSYFADGVGILLLDIDKTNFIELLENSGISELNNLTDKISKTRLTILRFKD